MKLEVLCVLLVGLQLCGCRCVEVCSPGTPKYYAVLQGNVKLQCPLAMWMPPRTMVTWRRQSCGKQFNYVFPKRSTSPGQRFFSRTPEELLIIDVIHADSGMYFCNDTKVGYLNVTKGADLPLGATVGISLGATVGISLGAALIPVLAFTFIFTVWRVRRGGCGEEQVEEVVEERVEEAVLYSEIPDRFGVEEDPEAHYSMLCPPDSVLTTTGCPPRDGCPHNHRLS